MLRKAGHVMLDCPVSGTGAQAKVKDLVVYASGDAAEIKRLRPMFAAFTRAVHDVGDFGNGSQMKYVANLLVAINNVASAEAMVLGMKAGLPPQLIFDLIKAGAGNSRIFELRAPMMVKDRLQATVTMKIAVWDKDMEVIGGYARKINVPTPMFDACKPIYLKALQERLRRPGHRRGLRRAGEDGRREARQGEATKRMRRSRVTLRSVGCQRRPCAGIHALSSSCKDVDGRDKPSNEARWSWSDPPTSRMQHSSSEIRDGMRIDWDVPITMDDGLVLRADVFRPVKDGHYPVILSYGPYAKGLAFQDGYPSAWQRMAEKHPDVTAGSSNLYQSWEVVDPEKWVPHDYACVRVDSRGGGCSPGFIDHFSPRETKDFYDCIEWAGVQPWSNGKVGLNGISYYGINQWHVASLQPPHLAAMCIWEGAADWYRDMTHHGGILSTFWENWYDMQVKTVQYGAGERGKRSRVHGELVCGPEILSEAELAKNRSDFGGEIRRASARRRLSPRPLAGVVEGQGAVSVGGQLGRPGAASARQFRRLRARRLEAQMARSARHRALDAFLHRLRPRAAIALLRSFPARQEQRLGQAAAGAAAGAPRRPLRRARRERMAAQAHPMDEVLSRSVAMACSSDKPASRKRRSSFEAMGDGVTFLDAAAGTRDRDHRAVGAQTVRLVLDQGRRHLRRAAGVHRRPQGSRVPGRHRSAYADRAGLAARLAPQARQETVDALPALSHAMTRSSR